MSERWVSQARKWCTLCKCWFADTKSAVENHESGKKHKEAVQLKLREMRKMGSG